MYMKKLFLTFAMLSIVSCNTTSVSDVNNDIVASNSSGLITNSVTNTYNRKEVKRISPITQEHVVKLETVSALSKTVQFAFDSDIIDEQGTKNLDAIAKLLKSQRKVSIIVEGHCDERGTKAYNLALGARRAQAVKNYLVDQGVSKRRIETVSYGEERPVMVGATRKAYAKNRRAEFKVR